MPVVCVSGFGGEEQMWATNSDLGASIGADTQLQLGIDDRGKGMSWTDFGFVVLRPACILSTRSTSRAAAARAQMGCCLFGYPGV